MKDDLVSRGVEIKTMLTVNSILTENGRVVGVSTDSGDFYAQNVIVAPGREGTTGLPRKQVGLG